MNENELYNYEYSDDIEDETHTQIKAKESVSEKLKCPLPIWSMWHTPKKCTEEDLYVYEEVEEEGKCENENAIFSRVRSPAPRNRKEC